MDASPQQHAAATLATPVQFLKGVGPERAKLLERIGLRTARDLLFAFPRSYQDLSDLRPIERLTEDTPVSVCGVVEEVELRNIGIGRSLLGVLIRQETQYLRALWFNQPYLRERFQVGRRVMLSGKARLNGFRWEMTHPRVELLGDSEEPPAGRILPVYSLTEGVTQPAMRRIVGGVVESLAGNVEEALPEELRQRKDLLPIEVAVRQVHQPSSRDLLAAARRRLIYQELLVMQLAIGLRRGRLRQSARAPALPGSAKIDARIRRLFPFPLTGDQERAVAEIAADLGREFPMNRLLQGDVGSGKTVIAEYAMLQAVANQHQAVLMAPTEILARQHVRTLERDLKESRVRIALLTGSLTAAQRRETLDRITRGEVDLIVGTQAVVQEGVAFHRLGLVIIDEQHRFGVRQRALLRQAGVDPHYLVMTATPIPRTIAMTLYGDLDVSTLRQTPPGRQPVHTYLGEESKRDRWWEFFRKKLREGRQGYVIAPLVGDGSDSETHSVESAFESLTNGELEAFHLAMLHGRQSAAEKEAIMQGFAEGAIQVLVATSVVEVGIDVPNATVMTIEGGQRFGLAQLHQLRGRVSRGPHPGYVCVFADAGSEDVRQRLEAFCQTNDGFALAELDFQQRGPGDLFSFKQHGLPPLYIADLTRDAELLQEARGDALRMLEQSPDLSASELHRLREKVLALYGSALELGDVG